MSTRSICFNAEVKYPHFFFVGKESRLSEAMIIYGSENYFRYILIGVRNTATTSFYGILMCF